MNPLRRLTLDQVKHVLKQKSVFERVEQVTGVPWQAVAAVWYRESFSVAPPKRVGGQFQFDPPPQRTTLRKLLQRFTKMNAWEIETTLDKGINDFPSAAIFAACWLRLKAKAVITPQASDEDVKDALYGYNGKKYGNVEKSPYVMNGWDEPRMTMHLRGTVPDIHHPGQKIWVDIEDERPGAFCVYQQLRS